MSDTRPLADLAFTSPSPMKRLPVLTPGVGFTLLDGVYVLDLTTSVAGPFATQLLADFGAVVVKVERRGNGDDSRAWGPPFLDGEALWFVSVNRNKRSLALDYGKPDGAAVLRELVAKADVVVLKSAAARFQQVRPRRRKRARVAPRYHLRLHHRLRARRRTFRLAMLRSYRRGLFGHHGFDRRTGRRAAKDWGAGS